MPELPEVETVSRGLRIKIVGKKILSYHQFRKDLRWLIPPNIKEKIEGAIVLSIYRKGKFLLINFNVNYTLIIHLGMSGRLLVYDNSHSKKSSSKEIEMGVFHHTLLKLGKHDHVKIDFDDGSQLVFNDVRRFGAIDLSRTDRIENHKWLVKLGPEPLSNHFSSPRLKDKIQLKKCSIKVAILDQNIVIKFRK